MGRPTLPIDRKLDSFRKSHDLMTMDLPAPTETHRSVNGSVLHVANESILMDPHKKPLNPFSTHNESVVAEYSKLLGNLRADLCIYRPIASLKQYL
jgi:hypothetical protein